MENETKHTTDEQTIREWAEERSGYPAWIKEDESDAFGIPCIDFGGSDQDVERISWETFFEVMRDMNLVFLYHDDEEDGAQSRVCSFVPNERVPA